MGGVELVKPRAVHIGLAAVPAEVVVVGYDVGYLQVGIVDLAHRYRRDGGQAGLIHLVTHIVEDAVIFEQIVVRAADTDLVGESPHDDRGMVVVLDDEFLHLRNSVLSAGGHMLGDVGNLRPDDKSALIAQVIEILVVLIMGKANGGCAHLADKVDVLLVMLREKGVTKTPAVLMARYAAQRIFLAVEDKAVFGIDLEGAATEAGRDIINYLAVFDKLDACGVEVGIFLSVPEVDRGDAQGDLCIVGGGFGNDVALFILDDIVQVLTDGSVGDIAIDLNLGICALDLGGDLQAGAAVVVEVKVGTAYADEVYIAVKSAVEGKVGHLRIDRLVGRVVDLDDQKVYHIKRLGQFNAPGRIAAVVLSEQLAVEVDLGRGVGTLYLKIVPVGSRQVGLVEAFGIVGGAAIVIVVAVLSVDSVPGMRQVDKVPLARYLGRQSIGELCERPFLIKIKNCSHNFPPRFFII